MSKLTRPVACMRRGENIGRDPSGGPTEFSHEPVQGTRPFSGAESLHAALWCVIVLASPLYVFPPGLPQPFHLLIATALIGGAAALLPLVLSHRDLIIPLWAFLGYAALVNSMWFAIIQDTHFLFSTLYLIFNALVFLYVVALVRLIGRCVIALTCFALAVSTGIELLITMYGLPPSHPSGGALGSFTNPNQLAYWAVLAAAAIFIIKKNQEFTLIDAAVVSGTVVLVVLSLSRAGVISMALLIAVGTVAARKSAGLKAGMAMTIACVMIVVLFYADEAAESIGLNSVQAEFARDTPWDGPAGRGYDRLWLFSEYLLFGAGEGGFERFATAPLFFDNELHSSFGTIVFCYGVIGTILFCVFLLGIFRRLDLYTLVCLGPVFVFGFVHNSFRFSFFWMVLGLGYGIHSVQNQTWRAAEPPLAHRLDLRRHARGEDSHPARANRPRGPAGRNVDQGSEGRYGTALAHPAGRSRPTATVPTRGFAGRFLQSGDEDA